MNRNEVKAQRLIQIEKLLWAHPEGLTRAEIARRLGVHRSTITRYLDNDHLPPSIYEDHLDGKKLKINPEADLTKVSFSLHEIMALHLATRLLATRMDKSNPHAASALRKLGRALSGRDHNISRHILLSADVMDEAEERQDPVYLKVLETLTEAWSRGYKVRVSHLMPDGKVFEYKFSPYFIEPYAVGHTTHVIGYREPPGAIRTFKIERLKAAKLLHERYDIPEDFDPRELLRNAWGIWYTEKEPVEVVLRFHPGVALRVKETRWHHAQELEEQPDGYLLWRAKVAEPKEMLPWIRGWGADVEVLAPETLRRALESEAQRLAEIYLEDNHTPPSWFWLWAKADAESGRWHPLIYHLIDVGVTARALWHEALTDAVRDRYARLLGLSVDEAGRLFAFLAATHDLGKASPAFQAKVDFLRPQLTRQGFQFPPSLGENGAPHGHITTWALKKLLPQHLEYSKQDAIDIAHAVGGHHGVWPQIREVQDRSLMAFDKGDAFWDQARVALLQQLVERFQPPTDIALPTDVEDRNALLIFLSGFTTTADWLGSMGEFFEYEERWMGSERYARLAADISHDALTKTGWIGWRPRGEQRSFTDLFPFTPNAIQQTLFDLALDAQLPALVILEAPTGGGKTEAALYLADVWLQRERGRGLYVAMPTQATSNQMFDRTARFLAQRYPGDALNIHLVHGNAAWTSQFQDVPLVGIGENLEDGLAARTWFLPRKRTLLAPFGVGTVDQAFLGVLMARHFFLRLYGLGTKVLIFDEVHAYDTYMSAIFLRLLTWLRVMGTSVIILSATLPESTRRAMVAAFSGKQPDTTAWPETPYPRITLVQDHEITTAAIPVSQERAIQLDWLPDDEHIIETLREELADGGCAAVICNTVGRAQEVYLALKEAGLVAPENLTLFHARMPFAWRKEIEERVLQAFGKSGQRPHKAIVVATQVIEQSLDLDFDLMISELAPIDLIIQRAGRLHRHPRDHRPPRLAQPRLLLIRPQGDMTDPEFGSSRHIYQPYLLWQTWRALEHRDAMHLPADTESLIEAVYGPFQPETLPEALQKPLTRAYQAMEKDFRSAQFEADIRLAPPPTEKKLVTRQPIALSEDDDPRVHEQIRAMTRLIGPTLNIICLHRTPAGIFLEPDGSGPAIDLENPPPRQLVPDLLQRGVTIQRRDIIRQLMERLPWPGWKEIAALRYHAPVVFEHGAYTLDDGRYILHLDRELGLRIVKKEDDA